MFPGFVWGGFEGATHRRADRKRVDSVAGSGHDRWAGLDHALLRSIGIRMVRESLRWHLIEATPGRYDWDSARAQVQAALSNGMAVAWGLCHWGVPDHLDVMAPDWPRRFADFTHAAALWLHAEGVDTAAWVPVNEMSFWAWAGGETGGFAPHLHEQGDRLKRRLVAAHLAAVDALRAAGAHQPVLVCEPLIWVLPRTNSALQARRAARILEASFAAVAEILERDPHAIDVLGLNFYAHNQWRIGGVTIRPGERGYRPLRDLLADVRSRFPRLRLVLAETGREEPSGAAWLDAIAGEAAAARAAGIPLEAVCVYPVMDYPGWDNERHCPCGPIGVDEHGRRLLRAENLAAIRRLAQAGAVPLR